MQQMFMEIEETEQKTVLVLVNQGTIFLIINLTMVLFSLFEARENQQAHKLINRYAGA